MEEREGEEREVGEGINIASVYSVDGIYSECVHFFNFLSDHLCLLISPSLSHKGEETCFFIIQAFVDHVF